MFKFKKLKDMTIDELRREAKMFSIYTVFIILFASVFWWVVLPVPVVFFAVMFGLALFYFILATICHFEIRLREVT